MPKFVQAMNFLKNWMITMVNWIGDRPWAKDLWKIYQFDRKTFDVPKDKETIIGKYPHWQIDKILKKKNLQSKILLIFNTSGWNSYRIFEKQLKAYRKAGIKILWWDNSKSHDYYHHSCHLACIVEDQEAVNFMKLMDLELKIMEEFSSDDFLNQLSGPIEYDTRTMVEYDQQFPDYSE